MIPPSAGRWYINPQGRKVDDTMPWKPKRICSYPGCRELTHDSYCQRHTKHITKQRNLRNSKLYNYQWRKESKAYLKAYPWCVSCKKEKRYTPATEVDHIIPHNNDRALFWDRTNWQSMCKSCHSRKTVVEDGGFDNARKWLHETTSDKKQNSIPGRGISLQPLRL